jgi:CxxC motif-containing protein
MPEITEEMICITCPMGCTLQVTHDGETLIHVDGNTCSRGLAYVESELTDPRRMVATTVRVRGGLHPLVPVYTEGAFPKPRIFALLHIIREVEVEAPVKVDQVIIENALDTGINIIASRDMPRLAPG